MTPAPKAHVATAFPFTASQHLMLAALHAEIGALQAILPGLELGPAPARGPKQGHLPAALDPDETTESAFDNMPV